jgi:hypothetical protein
VGLIARVLEQAGIATVCIIMRREVAENVKPPRALFVKFPGSLGIAVMTPICGGSSSAVE